MKKIFLKENRHILFNSSLCTLLLLILVLNFKYFPITKFNDRIIGSMVLNNFNNIGFIKFMYLILFFIFPLLLFICFKIFNKMYNNLDINICKFNKLISIFGLISYFFGFFGFLNNQGTFNSFFLSFVFFGISIFNIILYKNIKVKNHKELFTFSILISIPLSIFGSLFINRLNFIHFNNHIIFIIIYFFFILFSFYFCRKLDFNKLTRSSTIFLSSLIFHPLYLELYNILNQYNIIIAHKYCMLILMYILLFFVSGCYYNFFAKSKKFDYKKYFYVIIIIGISLLQATNSLVTIINTDFFESANHGLSIYELFKYGKIPIIENFDAHLLSNEVFGILYGILNHDISGAIFNIYSSYEFVIICLVMYFLIKYFLDRDYAFLGVLVIPFIKDAALNNLYLGFISIYFFLNAINKNTFKSFLLFWLSLAITCIWRLDIGFSISMSCVVLLIYLLVLNHKKYNMKSIIMSFLSIILLFSLVYFLICFVKNINPITRLIEFLKISLSNSNWAYFNIGNPNTYAYYLYYYILPIITIISLFYLLWFKYKNYDNQSLILILLALFYIFNFQRGLVRHSLVENTLRTILSYTLFYFSFFIYYIKKENNKFIPVLVYSILLVISSFTIDFTFDNYSSLFINYLNKELSYELESQVSNVKVKRIVLSEKMRSEYSDLSKVLSLILNKNETYLDFSNQSLLYAILGYEKPVYVNQSPGLLSGERTQQMFISEINNFKNKVPIVLKSKSKPLSAIIDGVPNDFRYYLISEYIYNNYVLLSNVNDYEIWVKKDYYEKAKEILNKNNINLYKDSNIKYDKKIELAYIPYIWGKENINTKVIEKLNIRNNNNKFNINIQKDKINKANGNYLVFSIENFSENTSVTLNLISKNDTFCKLKFIIPKGNNTYKIRISSLYAWYFNNIDEFELQPDANIKINKAYICEGDILRNVK